ncbi:MAG TPA: hypothetical protein VLB29_14325 [Nocardioidaceae bacterium]|nr:hypothetical protein [Nocardioidaceae bacterium]
MQRKLIGVLASLVLLPLVIIAQAGAASTASAAPTICEPNQTWISIKSVTKPWRLTHIARYGVAPGTNIKTTWSASSTTKIVAGIEAWGEGSVSANGVIGAAEVKAGVKLAANLEKTYTGTVSDEVSFSSAKKKRVYAYFRGYRRYSGGFEKWRCSSDGKSKSRVKYGNWRSFRTGVYAQETTLCARGGEWLTSTYPAGSLDRLACKAIR